MHNPPFSVKTYERSDPVAEQKAPSGSRLRTAAVFLLAVVVGYLVLWFI
jgi:hypothetical protein